MRRNSVILLHGFEAALNDNWSVPICPFFLPKFPAGEIVIVISFYHPPYVR
jgi:hypothetical protein